MHLHTDPRHRRANPYIYRREEMEACWRRIEAPVLIVMAGESDHAARLEAAGGVASLRALVRKLELATVAGAGHKMASHHAGAGILPHPSQRAGDLVDAPVGGAGDEEGWHLDPAAAEQAQFFRVAAAGLAAIPMQPALEARARVFGAVDA